MGEGSIPGQGTKDSHKLSRAAKGGGGGGGGKNWDSIQGFSNFMACFLFFDIWTASSSYYFHHHHLLITLLGIILKPYVPTHFILKIILTGMSFYNLNFYSWENEAEA